MRQLNLERYCTPDWVAEAMVGEVPSVDVGTCADMSCGHGSLLAAAEARFPGVRCIGLDLDVAVVSALRRTRPNWWLSCGDFLSARSRASCQAVKRSVSCDVVLANPPFHVPGRRAIEILRYGNSFRCSVAMAHIVNLLDVLRPVRALIAIVPESLVVSELDEDARRFIALGWQVEIRQRLSASLFSGARARTALVRFVPASNGGWSAAVSAASVQGQNIVRGMAPLFRQEFGEGLPIIHSTDLRSLRFGLDPNELPKVKWNGQRTVQGWMVLIPRVGTPSIDMMCPLFLEKPHILTDCVIAMTTRTKAACARLAKMITDEWSSLESQYTGTGARFLTVRRLSTWLENHQCDGLESPDGSSGL